MVEPANVHTPTSPVNVHRTGIVMEPNESRVYFRPFLPGPERVTNILARVLALSEQEAEIEARYTLTDFKERHFDLHDYLMDQFEVVVRHRLVTDQPMSDSRKLLLGAYFSQEYALEAAALFNPSIVPHPDQTGCPEGCLRYILSLRATGEGHLSSITFRTGVIDAKGEIGLDEPSPLVTAAEVVPNPGYEKKLFIRKLHELGLDHPFTDEIMAELSDEFLYQELKETTGHAVTRNRFLSADERKVADGIITLARGNYEILFDPNRPLSERAIFPYSPAEVRGIEDARFVAFQEEDQLTYYATYTAFDGNIFLPQIIETDDFVTFRINTLNGPEVQNKGMALFPRKINGHYAMISRQDNENLYLMYSNQVHFWYTKQLLMRPTYPWEFVQIGNCGSPIETEAGWLLLTHGVGTMRRYSIGAVLLDLEDPGRVIGRLKDPLLTPQEDERAGYVPNVLYSCGALVHAGKLILPYAMSDHSSSFATVDLQELLEALINQCPTP